MKKVLTFSLWGNNKTYTIGAIKNAKQAKYMYPDFECWFYIHAETVPKEIIDQLALLDNTKIILKTGDLQHCKPMMWRFEAIDEDDVEIMLSRDTDTRILLRETLAVKAWLQSDKIFHIMRDHPHHNFEILGGMFGTKKIQQIRRWQELMANIIQQQHGDKSYDQHFLKTYIYEHIKERALIHAAFNKYEACCQAFPIPYDAELNFVGEYVYENDTRSMPHKNILSEALSASANEKIHLITSFYVMPTKDEISAQRNNELYACLYHNLQNPLIAKIHIYVDDLVALNTAISLNIQNKLVIVNIGKQPLYAEMFTYAMTHLKNTNCMIANSDIYLHKCEPKVLRQLEKNIFALSRHENNLVCEVYGFGSHDAFLFRPEYLKPEITHSMNHIQNLAGADDNIVNILVDHGYKLYNPCFEIILVHLHSSNVRTYNEQKIAFGKYFIKQAYFITADGGGGGGGDTNFTYYPGLDHNCDDLVFHRDCTIAELKDFCLKTPDSAGFNSYGFLKSRIDVLKLHETQWINKNTTHGIYVKK